MTTKTQILYFANSRPRAWGDCQRSVAEHYLALESIGKPRIMGFHDESHVWLEMDRWAIDSVLHNKIPTKEVIFQKGLHNQLIRQYLPEYGYKKIIEFEPRSFVRRWSR